MRDETLPQSWAAIEIEECLLPYANGKKIRQGWSPQCEKHPAQSHDEWAVLKTSAIQDGLFIEDENKQLPRSLEPRAHLEVEAGDILITCAGPRARCGVACLIRTTRPRLLISGKMYQLRADPQVIERQFLELFLREATTKKEIDEMKTGISDSGLNLTHDRFRKLTIPLPPLAEQRRIVAKIEELFSELEAGEESLRLARRQLATYRQSLLKQAFQGHLTAKWREETKTTDKWRYESFGAFIAKIDAGKSFRCEERRPKQDEIGVAKVSAVTWGEYDEAESKTCVDPAKVNPGYFIREGDFLISRANTIELVGACVIARRVTQKVMLSDKTLRLHIDGAHKSFFLHYLRSRQGRREIEKRSTGNQESMRNIGQEGIRSIEVPVCPLPEQHEIVRLLDEQFEVIERNEREIDAALRRSEALRQSILHRAFTGRLVPQDPADEPATELLARLRAEKQSAPLRKPKSTKPKL